VDVERAVQVHVDLGAVVAGNVHLVVAVLAADLGTGDAAAPGVGERGGAGLAERLLGDRALVAVAAGHGHPGTATNQDDGQCRASDPPGLAIRECGSFHRRSLTTRHGP